LTEQDSRAESDGRERPLSSPQGEAESAEEATRERPPGRLAHDEADVSYQAEQPSANPGHLNEAVGAAQRHKTSERGQEIQDELDRIELEAAGRKYGPSLLGVALAIGVIVGGAVAFLAVFVLLVGVIR
jgi:hypothetical protein